MRTVLAVAVLLAQVQALEVSVADLMKVYQMGEEAVGQSFKSLDALMKSEDCVCTGAEYNGLGNSDCAAHDGPKHWCYVQKSAMCGDTVPSNVPGWNGLGWSYHACTPPSPCECVGVSYNGNGDADCHSHDGDKHWCYVKQNAECGDNFNSNWKAGEYQWSYNACKAPECKCTGDVYRRNGGSDCASHDNGNHWCYVPFGADCGDNHHSDWKAGILDWSYNACPDPAVQAQVSGCTDSSAVNYKSVATKDDGSCDYCKNRAMVEKYGCAAVKASGMELHSSCGCDGVCGCDDNLKNGFTCDQCEAAGQNCQGCNCNAVCSPSCKSNLENFTCGELAANGLDCSACDCSETCSPTVRKYLEEGMSCAVIESAGMSLAGCKVHCTCDPQTQQYLGTYSCTELASKGFLTKYCTDPIFGDC